MDPRTHWDNIYTNKSADAVSWYRQHLEISLNLIQRVARVPSASIIDVGGGESTLVDDLLARGYQDITVLDISQAAIDVTQARLGANAERVRWLAADIGKANLEPSAYDVWHDRAVFHFLTSNEERISYVSQVVKAVRPAGHVIVSTFGPEGPKKCSGLEVVRYDAESWGEIPAHGKLRGAAYHSFWHCPAIPLLPLQSRMRPPVAATNWRERRDSNPRPPA